MGVCKDVSLRTFFEKLSDLSYRHWRLYQDLACKYQVVLPVAGQMLAQYAVRISLKVTLSECFCLKHEKGKDVRKLSIFLTYGTEYGARYLCIVKVQMSVAGRPGSNREKK